MTSLALHLCAGPQNTYPKTLAVSTARIDLRICSPPELRQGIFTFQLPYHPSQATNPLCCEHPCLVQRRRKTLAAISKSTSENAHWGCEHSLETDNATMWETPQNHGLLT